MARSRQARAAPSEQAAMLTRPPSSPRMAILNPSPSAPIRFCHGTRQPSKVTTAVGCERQPIFFSGLPNARPGVPFSTSTELTPAGPSPPVRHMTR